jgi:hypothetical protein
VTLSGEPVAAPSHRFDIRPAPGSITEQPAQRGNHLLQTVVGHSHVFPRRRDERVLGCDRSGVGQQLLQDAEMAVADREPLATAGQLVRPGVEAKGAEHKNAIFIYIIRKHNKRFFSRYDKGEQILPGLNQRYYVARTRYDPVGKSPVPPYLQGSWEMTPFV